MSEVDQGSYYCDGLKRATQAYVKLQYATTLSEEMNHAAKYEMSHLGGERKPTREKLEREQQSRGRASYNPSNNKKPFSKKSFKPGHYAPAEQAKEGTVCYYCMKPGHFKRDCKKLKNPLVYTRAPLFSLEGSIVQGVNNFGAKILLDCGATTVYMSRGFVKKHELKTHAYTDRTIKVKLGDNKIGESILELMKIEILLQGVPNYQCVAVVFDIPEEFDGVLGMPFFVDIHPDIDWKNRCIKVCVSDGASTAGISTPCGKCSPGNGSGPYDAVNCERTSAISRDSCRAAVPETRLEGEVESVERPAEDVEKLVKREKNGSEGVETKYITWKKLRKFLRLPAKDQPEHDFMIVLTNDTIKEIERDLNRSDEPDNVGSEKVRRFLNTDWEPFNDNPAYPVLVEYKDNVFKPELPDGLLMECDIEHRIDVKDPNTAMYRQQWRLSPEQKTEIDNPHAAPTFCVRKPVGWRIVHDYRYLNSNTIRQSVPMTHKEDVSDSMAGAYYFSCMDLMSAYYQVRMKMDHVKYTAFQAPNGLYEYLVLPMGVSNAPATMHRLTSSLFKGLSHTRSFYDDIYAFTKSKDMNEHLRALRNVLEILKENKLQSTDNSRLATQEQLHSFRGLTGYVQRFCEQYAELTAPLFTLLKKKTQRNSKITLNAVQLKSFKDLKRRLSDTFTRLHEADALANGRKSVRCGWCSLSSCRWDPAANRLYQPEDEISRAEVPNSAAGATYDYGPQVTRGNFPAENVESTVSPVVRHPRRVPAGLGVFTGAKNGIADALSRRPDLKPETKEFHDLLVPSFNETSFQLRVAEIRPTNEVIKLIINRYDNDKIIREIRRAVKRRGTTANSRGMSEKQYKTFFEEKNLIWYQGTTE
ncbi:hypothetical protein F443_20800 [Phytophthora nicotianae P1569]|uniref:CCHC-type domain-containing protein n=1 Tax=Phytophthora nicotianae P1569 TaxID=1317065 RepID=V9E299_PHYNI|nr:hypothetical protein F443_20800 [Phytophthora nicotianae P1569]